MEFIVYVTSDTGRIALEAEGVREAVEKTLRREIAAGRSNSRVCGLSCKDPQLGFFVSADHLLTRRILGNATGLELETAWEYRPPSVDEVQRWQLAVDTFSCSFCGRPKGRRCGRVEATYDPPLPDLVKPHEPRLRLLTETDPAIQGSFSL